MSDLAQLMRAQFQQMLLDLEISFSAEQVSHPGERGRLLEDVLRTFLIKTLPRRIGIGTGQIIEATKKNPSRQVDIVLYDALNYPLLLNEASFQLFPSEAVLVTIEVKSVLNQKHLSRGIENIASSKVLRKFPLGKHPATLGILFCYRTTWKTPRGLLRNLWKEAKANQSQIPDIICSLKPGFLLVATKYLGESIARLGTPLAGMEQPNDNPPDKLALITPFGDFSKEYILLWFYLLLIDYINRALGIGINMAQYTKSSMAWKLNFLDLKI